MANRLPRMKRLVAAAASTVLLGTVGCAFPHGNTAGDPMLGSFNRPIVPTPPPERGGLGLDTPAYDGGARIGLLSPDVPTPPDPGTSVNVPPPTGVFSGMRTPFGTNENTDIRRSSGGGAKLPSLGDAAPRTPGFLPAAGRFSPEMSSAPRRDGVSFITSAASFTPVESPSAIRPVGYDVPWSDGRMSTVEEGNKVLADLGAKGQRMEQLTGGDWLCACTIDNKVYEGRGADPVEAMRKVMMQAKK